MGEFSGVKVADYVRGPGINLRHLYTEHSDREALPRILKQLHDSGTEIDGYFVGHTGPIDPNAPIELDENEQRYLEQLNAAVIYAQQAYFNALAFLRRKYEAPEAEWTMNNINVGFERINR